MNCWAQKPDQRPPFDTLQQDLDDFEISCEDKYSQYDQFVPNYRKIREENLKEEKVGKDQNKSTNEKSEQDKP